MPSSLRSLWAVCVLCFLPLALRAQTEAPEAFTWLDPAPRPAPSLAADRFQDVAPRFDLLRAGPPELALPLLGGATVRAERTGFESRGALGFTWRGRIAGTDGTAVLTVHGASLAGRIESPEGIYEIVPRGRGTSSLVLLDTESFPAEAESPAPARDALPDLVAASFSTVSHPDPQGRIDVMVLYTPSARAAAGGTDNIRATAQAAVDAANTAYANSQITTRLRLVHTQEVAYDDSYAYEDHLAWLSADPGVARLRESHRADLVDLLVEDGEYCGIGWVMSSVTPLFAGNGFSVTTRSCAVGNLSFAHELGHNMGSQHDPANGSPFASFPFSYGHFVSGVFRTVMSYSTHCLSNCPRVSRFSNPNLTWAGHPTGIASFRDNHRTLNATDAVVANFRQQAPASDFYTVPPCRVVDTRGGAPLLSGVSRTLPVAGSCGIPADAVAVALNVTVADPTGLGNLRLYPANTQRPDATAINFLAGVNRANAAVLPLSTDGAGTLAAEPFLAGGGSVHLILDVVGYFGLPEDDVWIPREPMPRGRVFHASAVLGGRIYLLGGSTDAGTTDAVESFDPATGQWRTECPLSGIRDMMAAAALNGRIYVFGGQEGGPDPSSVVQEFDPTAASCATAWTTKNPLPLPLAGADAVALGDRIYLIGGFTAQQSLLAYDPAADTWTPKASLPSARIDPAAAVLEGRIYLVGGGYGSGHGALLVYDPAADAWSSRASLLIPSRQHVAAAVGGRIYVVGGETSMTQEYDPAGDQWTLRTSLPTLPHEAVAAAVDGRMYILGGVQAGIGILDDQQAYIPPLVP